MKTYTIDQLALLPEDRAIERWSDDRNFRITRVAFLIAAFTSAVCTMVFASHGHMARTILVAANFVLLGLIYLNRRHRFFRENFRPVMIAWLIVQYAVFVLAFYSWGVALALSSFVFPLLLVFYRFRPSQYLALVAVFAVAGFWFGVTLKSSSVGGGGIWLQLVFAFFCNGGLGAIGLWRLTGHRSRFLQEWRMLATRERERERMREELADARKIQLAMLPDAAPITPTVDFASVSLPATEVGGDYFDFFPLAEGQVAVVIGDVAGHGVASGLVLAGIKSGLFVLRDELSHPLPVVEKLNATARDWLRWRMLVTLLIAVIDVGRKTLRVVTAGHLPLLHYSASSRTIRQIGGGSLPLGTRLASRYSESETAIAPGDAILLYTDGVSELLSPSGEPFGEQRLVDAFRDAAVLGSATMMRDRILEKLSSFKGGREQDDDLTLVVARLKQG